MLDLDCFMWLETEFGVPVANLSLRGGHYLVYKIPMREHKTLALPDTFKSRAVKNIVAIKGLVLRSSEPFRPKKAKQRWEWDKKQTPPIQIPKYDVVDLPETEPAVQPGQCVLYNSYNLLKVGVAGLTEPLVVIREIDMLAVWDPEYDEQVELSDHALQHVLKKSL